MKKGTILAIPAVTRRMFTVGLGFTPMGEVDLAMLFSANRAWFGPREFLEDDDTYNQVIPYVILTHQGKIGFYRRTPKGGEERLYGKGSIGFGGHVEMRDARYDNQGHFDWVATMERSIRRELAEEVIIGDIKRAYPVGTLYLDKTAVDQVHVGLIYMVETHDDILEVREDHLESVEWLYPEEVEGEENLEGWTMELLKNHLDHLLKQVNNKPLAPRPDLSKGMWYLATPYSAQPGDDRPVDEIHEERYQQACIAVAALELMGYHIFSPICNHHGAAKVHRGETSAEHYRKRNAAELAVCEGLIVGCFPGWENSTGVRGEIDMAKLNGQQMVYASDFTNYAAAAQLHLLEDGAALDKEEGLTN